MYHLHYSLKSSCVAFTNFSYLTCQNNFKNLLRWKLKLNNQIQSKVWLLMSM